MSSPAGLHTRRCNPLKRAPLLNRALSCPGFPQSLAQARGNRASVAGEPLKQLAVENSLSRGSPRLYSLNWICRKLARSFDFSISHVRREHNTEADGLASSAVRKQPFKVGLPINCVRS
jgi:hypothetical protein